MGRRRRVNVPDGLVHVVVAVVDGELQDPVVTVDAVDASAVASSMQMAWQDSRRKVTMGIFKVPVTPAGRDVDHG